MSLPETVVQELTAFLSELKINNTQIAFRGKNLIASGEDRRAKLIELVYSQCYALKQSASRGKATMKSTEDSGAFLKNLIQSNRSIPQNGKCWEVREIFAGNLVELAKGTVSKVVSRSQVQHAGEFRKGQLVNVEFPNGDSTIQEGFYYTYSNVPVDHQTSFTRVYWNITAGGAAPLITAITGLLNRYEIPFLFKCLDRPGGYSRRDAAVLYLESRHLDLAVQLFPDIIKQVETWLEKDVPLFTFCFHPGVGIAESPNENESLGMHRARLVTSVLLDAANEQRTPFELIARIEKTFLAEGLNPEKPYLNTGSKFLFTV